MSKDLPPEAYTRETLQEAFNWLQDQPEPVRATIHTPERLVSLYRKSQRLNDQDAPVSSKKFIDDLKSLATSLNQFGTTTTSTASVRPALHDYNHVNSSHFNNHRSANFEELQMSSSNTQATDNQNEFETKSKKTSIVMTQETQQTTQSSGLKLDSTTLERVQNVKNRFNLSSDTEALRLLVSLGFEKFSQF